LGCNPRPEAVLASAEKQNRQVDMASHQRDEYRELVWRLSWRRQRAAELGIDRAALLIRMSLDEIQDSPFQSSTAGEPSKQKLDTPLSPKGSPEL
jgi:hypothetical protein